jgi:uncharacterized protein
LPRAFKIVVTGPYNSGKSTFIGAVSEIEVVSTERDVSSGGGSRTTVAMDFGRITLRDGDVLHLYGTPGQARFRFMWEILSGGMLGYVVLLDGSDPSTYGDGRGIIETFDHLSDAPYVVGLTRSDRGGCLEPEEARRRAGIRPGTEIVPCDARDIEDVKDVLLALLERVMEVSESVGEAG